MADVMESPVNNVAPPAKRALFGLTPGRIVLYVMTSCELRPAIVTRVVDAAGIVNAVLFFDENDMGNFPQPRKVGDSGYYSHYTEHLAGVEYCEPEQLELDEDPPQYTYKPGSWHWPTRQPVFAASVDAGAMHAIVDSMLAEAKADMQQGHAEFLSMLNQKLQTSLETMNLIADSTVKLVEGLSLLPPFMSLGRDAVNRLEEQVTNGAAPMRTATGSAELLREPSMGESSGPASPTTSGAGSGASSS